MFYIIFLILFVMLALFVGLTKKELLVEVLKTYYRKFLTFGQIFNHDRGIFVLDRTNPAVFVAIVSGLLYLFIIRTILKNAGDEPLHWVVHLLFIIGLVSIALLVYCVNVFTEWQVNDVMSSLSYEVDEVDEVPNMELQSIPELISPEHVSFSAVDGQLHLHSGLLANMWIRRSNQNLLEWVTSNMTTDFDDCLDIIEEEFQRILHVMVATSDELISPALPYRIENVAMQDWFDPSFLPLLYNPPEMNSQLHKIYVRDGDREQFLHTLRRVRENLRVQYRRQHPKELILIYQRLCMLEIVYRKTESWRKSPATEFVAVRNGVTMEVIFYLEYDIGGHIEPALDGIYQQYQSHWIMRKCSRMIKDVRMMITDEADGLKVHVTALSNGFCDHHNYHGYIIRHLIDRCDHSNQEQSTYVCGDFLATNEYQSRIRYKEEVDMRCFINDTFVNPSNRGGIVLKGMDLNTFDIAMDNRFSAKYRLIDDELEYRWLELSYEDKLVMVYAGDGDFKTGVRKIKRLHLNGDRTMQEKLNGLIPSGVNVEWDDKVEHNDHTYAHNLSMIKRAEIINKVAGTDVVLEIGSNLNSQLYTSGLVINLATITQSDVERRINLMDQAVRLLRWENQEGERPNRYICLNFQSLEHINMRTFSITRVIMHNVIHNIPIDHTVKFMLRHPSIEVIETSTYLPLGVLSQKIVNDEDSGMLWRYTERQTDEGGLFHSSSGSICAQMPAGDPVYVHDPSILHDYFRTTVIHVKQTYNQPIEQTTMIVLTIKDIMQQYIRMRITRGSGLKALEKAVLTTSADLPQQIVHVKKDRFKTRVAVYPLDVSEMYRSTALLQMNTSRQRADMMRAVRTTKDDRRSMARLRILDAAERKVPIVVCDPMNMPSKFHGEHIFVISTFTSLQRCGRQVVIPHEVVDNIKSRDIEDIVHCGNYDNSIHVLDAHNVSRAYSVVGRCKTLINRWLMHYNLYIDNNGIGFYVDAGKNRVLSIERRMGRINLARRRLSSIYEEDLIALTTIEDVLNVFTLDLVSHSHSDCVLSTLRHFDIVRVNPKPIYSLKEVLEMIKHRQSEITRCDRAVDNELRTRYSTVVTSTMQGRQKKTSFVRNNNYSPVTSTEFLDLDPGRVAQYCLVYRQYIETNMRGLAVSGGIQIRHWLSNPSTLSRIQLLMLNGHLYEIVGDLNVLLCSEYAIGIKEMMLSQHVGQIIYGHEPMTLNQRSMFLIGSSNYAMLEHNYTLGLGTEVVNQYGEETQQVTSSVGLYNDHGNNNNNNNNNNNKVAFDSGDHVVSMTQSGLETRRKSCAVEQDNRDNRDVNRKKNIKWKNLKSNKSKDKDKDKGSNNNRKVRNGKKNKSGRLNRRNRHGRG